MINMDYYKTCDVEASNSIHSVDICACYLKSIARSLASIADNYEKILGDPKDNEEFIE